MVSSASLLLSLALLTTDQDLELEPDVHVMETRQFRFPLHWPPNLVDSIEQVVLYVSTDSGKAWKKVATASANQKFLAYAADHDGLYWFALQVIHKDNRKEPADLHDASHIRKVLVNTTGIRREGVLRLSRKRSPPREAVESVPGGEETVEALEKEIAALRARLKELEQQLAKAKKRQDMGEEEPGTRK